MKKEEALQLLKYFFVDTFDKRFAGKQLQGVITINGFDELYKFFDMVETLLKELKDA